MASRGKRWELEPGHSPCACGANVAVIRNMRSGERVMKYHKTPGGSTCSELAWQEAVERTRAIVAKLEKP